MYFETQLSKVNLLRNKQMLQSKHLVSLASWPYHVILAMYEIYVTMKIRFCEMTHFLVIRIEGLIIWALSYRTKQILIGKYNMW